MSENGSTIFKRIAMVIAGSTAVTLIIAAVAFILVEARTAKHLADTMIIDIAAITQDHIARNIVKSDSEALAADFARLQAMPMLDAVWVTNQAGRVLAYANAEKVCVSQCADFVPQPGWSAYQTEVFVADKTIGQLSIVRADSYIMREITRVALMLVAGLIVAGFLAYMAGRALSAQILAPLSALTGVARRVQDKPDALAPIDNPYTDEFGALTDAFNHMFKRLSQFQDNLKDWINSMPAILLGVSPDKQVILANATAKESCGTGVEGKALVDVCPFLRPHISQIENTLTQKTVETIGRVDVGQGQDKCHYHVVVYPLAQPNVGAVVRIDDMTHEIKLMDTMIQNEKMMSVGGLAAGMAHELNNPLAGMMQHAQNIARRLSTDLPANERAAEEAGLSLAQLSQYLESRGIFSAVAGIRELGERSATIVREMLRFSRKSDENMHLSSLNDIVRRAVDLCQHDPKFKHIEIHIDLDESLTPAPCHANEIEQVILNCMRNAAEAMMAQVVEQDNSITIRTKAMGVKAFIEIIDNGPGMTEAVKKRIFEPFYTTKEVGEGTGLGLSISYFIITDKHQGEMWVMSNRDKGTTMTIALPL